MRLTTWQFLAIFWLLLALNLPDPYWLVSVALGGLSAGGDLWLNARRTPGATADGVRLPPGVERRTVVDVGLAGPDSTDQ